MKHSYRHFLHSRYARAITPMALLALTAVYGLLLLRVPFFIAFLPCVIVAHRIGVLLHEFIHGIPLQRYRSNHNVVTVFDGCLLMWGTMEVFRGTHLAHHRVAQYGTRPGAGVRRPYAGARLDCHADRFGSGSVSVLSARCFGWQEALRASHAHHMCVSAFRDRCPVMVQRGTWGNRLERVLSVNLFTTLIPVSFRGAVEHYSLPENPASTNEYRVWIPLFNLNRHVHHHEQPCLPWYLLEFRTANPLSHWRYFTHWVHVYVTREFVLMQPEPGRGAPSSRCQGPAEQ